MNASRVLTTGRSDFVEGPLDVVLEGHAEQVTDEADLDPVARAFAVKYPAGPWDFVVRGGRVVVFRIALSGDWGSATVIASVRRRGGGRRHTTTPGARLERAFLCS